MKSKIKRKSLAERLEQGLREGIQFAKGELTWRTTEIPSPPADVAAKEVIALREKARMSQTVFARVLNVSTKTVQSWEQGQRRPSTLPCGCCRFFDRGRNWCARWPA